MTADRPKMPDIIASTHAAIDDSDKDDELMSLVGAVKKAAPARAAAHPATGPSGYHAQIGTDAPSVRYKKPTRIEPRSLVVNMRLTASERDRFYSFCEDRNLSLPDGLVALMDLAQV